MATTKISFLKFGSTAYQINDKLAFHAANLGYTANGKKYAIEQDAESGKLFVNVPWTDTTYTHYSGTSYASGLYKITVNNEGHVTAATAVAKADITALGIPGQDTTYTASAGVTIDAGVIKHTNSITALTSAALKKIAYDAQGHITSVAAVAKSDITALGIPAQDTTYSTGTLAQLNAGTDANGQLWAAKDLADWMGDILGVDLAKATNVMSELEALLEDSDKATGLMSMISGKADKGTYNVDVASAGSITASLVNGEYTTTLSGGQVESSLSTLPTATTTYSVAPTVTLSLGAITTTVKTNPQATFTKPNASTEVVTNPTAAVTQPTISVSAQLAETEDENDTLVLSASASGCAVTISGGTYSTTLTGGSVEVSGGAYESSIAASSVSMTPGTLSTTLTGGAITSTLTLPSATTTVKTQPTVSINYTSPSGFTITL